LETSPARRVIELNSVVLPAFVFPIRPILIGEADRRLVSSAYRIKTICEPMTSRGRS
jgi:hypothetical protein